MSGVSLFGVSLDGSSVTPDVRARWLQDTGWKEEEVRHYDNAGIEYYRIFFTIASFSSYS